MEKMEKLGLMEQRTEGMVRTDGSGAKEFRRGSVWTAPYSTRD